MFKKLFKQNIPPHFRSWVLNETGRGTTLNMALTASKFDTATWNHISHALVTFLQTCIVQGEKKPISEYRKFKAMESMYLEEPRKQLTEIGRTFWTFIKNGPIVNGRKCLSLAQARTEIFSRFNQPEFQQSYLHGVVHGDLSFQSIAYHEDTFSFRLLDSSGITGVENGYGDVRYDLAKLLLCSHGLYDFYSKGLFELKEKSPHQFVIKTHLTAEQLFLTQQFSQILRSSFAIRPTDLLFLESLLFLQMASTQKVFLLKGLELLTIVVEQRKLAPAMTLEF